MFEGEGQYHIFTGYNRDYPAQGRPAQVLMHAVSDDLYHWTKQMLSPLRRKGDPMTGVTRGSFGTKSLTVSADSWCP
ncbi:MAG: hypothetical protein ACLR2M_06995 [Varibaculum sp.]